MPPRRKSNQKDQKDHHQTSIENFFFTPSKKSKLTNPNPTSTSTTSSSHLNSSSSSSSNSSSNLIQNELFQINSTPIDDQDSFDSSIITSATSLNEEEDDEEENNQAFCLSPNPTTVNQNDLKLEFHPIHGLHPSWLEKLKPTLLRNSFIIKLHQTLSKRSTEDYDQGKKPKLDPLKIICPSFDKLYNWSHLTPLDQVKVIILGNEPSRKSNDSHGLAYSQSIHQNRISGTMNNIHTELFNQFPHRASSKPNHGSLVSWAESGVLLLNIIQTISRSPGESHHRIGWESFTDSLLEIIDRHGGTSIEGASLDHQHRPTKGLVFLIWGEFAFERLRHSSIPTSNRNHLILKTSHPQPSTSDLGFKGSHHFILTNQFLETHYGSASKIDWCELEKKEPKRKFEGNSSID
ncbi:uracil-DNA glycosylase-like protein [Melampsora americana]|nr:uracil-DNA glycosylase-like protein [Melampsora americana]